MSLKDVVKTVATTTAAVVGAVNLASPTNIETKLEPQTQIQQVHQQQIKNTQQRVNASTKRGSQESKQKK